VSIANAVVLNWILVGCCATWIHALANIGVGDAKKDHENMPRIIPFDFGKAIQVACGGEFSMVLNDSGQVFAFGHPEHGR
jgi:alpha-tubulin suppressor-like RCC1 family protein